MPPNPQIIPLNAHRNHPILNPWTGERFGW
jgi:hypothetical protein